MSSVDQLTNYLAGDADDEIRRRIGAKLLAVDSDLRQALDGFRGKAEFVTEMTGTDTADVVAIRQVGFERQEDGGLAEASGRTKAGWFWKRFVVLGSAGVVFWYIVFQSGWLKALLGDDEWRGLAGTLMVVSSWVYSRSKAREDQRPIWGTVWEGFSVFGFFMALGFYVNSLIGWWCGSGLTLSSTAQSIVWLVCWFCGYGMAVNALETGFGLFEKMVKLQWGWREFIGHLYLIVVIWGGFVSGVATLFIGVMLATWFGGGIILWSFLYSLPIAVACPCVMIGAEDFSLDRLPRVSAVLRHIVATLIVVVPFCLVAWATSWPLGNQGFEFHFATIVLPMFVLWFGTSGALMSDADWREIWTELWVLAEPLFVCLVAAALISNLVTAQLQPLIGGTFWHVLYGILVLSTLAAVGYAAYKKVFRPVTILWSWYGRMLVGLIGRDLEVLEVEKGRGLAAATDLLGGFASIGSVFGQMARTVAVNAKYRAAQSFS